MSLSKGNRALRAKNYPQALREYSRVFPNDPGYSMAQFNIRYIQGLPGINPFELPSAEVKSFDENPPLLSIVMPVFNVGPYLDASILSVRYQSFTDFELIIVNDASTDNGMDIISMHAALDSRIKVFDLKSNTPGGAGIPSNIGMRHARGKYIGFVDSDDWVTENAFEKLVEAAETHSADVAIGTFQTFIDDTREYEDAYDAKIFADIPADRVFTLRDHLDTARLSPVPWRKLYLRSFVETHDLYYPECDYFYEDNPLHWFVMVSGAKMVKADQIISYHRMAREGQTMSAAQYKLGALCFHLNTIFKYIEKHVNTQTDQEIISAFFAFCGRCGWVVSKQQRDIDRNLVGKQLATVFKRAMHSLKPTIDVQSIKNNFKRYNIYDDLDLTVVIPAYNCEEFIEETIQSVLNTPRIKFDVLVIDDGSTDGTAEICKKLEAAHTNLHFYEQKNRGAGRARNVLIPLCTGQYTYFLDADDTVDGEKLAEAVLAAKNADNDLFFFKYEIDFHDQNKKRPMFNPDQKLWEQFSSATSNDALRKLVGSLINYPWNRIIKTTTMLDSNVFFGPTVVHNDILFHWLSVFSAENIGFSNDVVCRHRKFETREQVTNVSGQKRFQAFDALEFVNMKVSQHPNFEMMNKEWVEFATKLLEWIKTRIPEEMMPEYTTRKLDIMRLLSYNVNKSNVA